MGKPCSDAGSVKTTIPVTVNIHSLRPCNFICGYCYAHFGSSERSFIPQKEIHEILRQVASAPTAQPSQKRKVTFAGGEPLLSKTILEDLAYAKSLGLITSVVTNGFYLTEPLIAAMADTLDWLCISIDGLDVPKNIALGRAQKGIALDAKNYLMRIQMARSKGIKIKINTVVSRKNLNDDFVPFITEALPSRWKIFQVSEISGENEANFADWVITEYEFREFVRRHRRVEDTGIVLVPETQADMRGTYAFIGPDGCFYDNSNGIYRISPRIVDVGIEAAFSKISFSANRFETRNGNYNFQTGKNHE